MNEIKVRQTRRDGERSRSAILREAAQLATTEGIEGLSIGRLAQAVGMSKSGLIAHFGTKQELQLATIETASAIFAEEVVEPALSCATGIGRLEALAENFLGHVERQVFPGGCFFASVLQEVDTHPGPVRDRAMQFMVEWTHQLETAARDAQHEGAIDPAEDAEQLVFELDAYLLMANALFVSTQEPASLERARVAIRQRLTAAASKG
jgi:AcrR family transcriptional regulator